MPFCKGFPAEFFSFFSILPQQTLQCVKNCRLRLLFLQRSLHLIYHGVVLSINLQSFISDYYRYAIVVIFLHASAWSLNYSFIAFFSLLLYRYVDVILQLIDKAGDFVSDDIWFRVVQFVTNNEDLQVTISLSTRLYCFPP